MTDELPEYVATSIKRRLAEDDRTGELGVQVDVRGGAVFLRGKVGTEERRSMAADVAQEVAPGLPIHNELTVVEAGDPAAEERFA